MTSSIGPRNLRVGDGERVLALTFTGAGDAISTERPHEVVRAMSPVPPHATGSSAPLSVEVPSTRNTCRVYRHMKGRVWLILRRFIASWECAICPLDSPRRGGDIKSVMSDPLFRNASCLAPPFGVLTCRSPHPGSWQSTRASRVRLAAAVRLGLAPPQARIRASARSGMTMLNTLGIGDRVPDDLPWDPPEIPLARFDRMCMRCGRAAAR